MDSHRSQHRQPGRERGQSSRPALLITSLGAGMWAAVPDAAHRPVNNRPQGRLRQRRAQTRRFSRNRCLRGWVDDHRVAEVFELGDQPSGVGFLAAAAVPVGAQVVVGLVTFQHPVARDQDGVRSCTLASRSFFARVSYSAGTRSGENDSAPSVMPMTVLSSLFSKPRGLVMRSTPSVPVMSICSPVRWRCAPSSCIENRPPLRGCR
jgi:hypothetical protein